MELEEKLHREYEAKRRVPRLVYRTVVTHLGQQYKVARIEISILGEEFYHTITETRDIDNLNQINNTLRRMHDHMLSGGVLNLEHWSRIEYTYQNLGI